MHDKSRRQQLAKIAASVEKILRDRTHPCLWPGCDSQAIRSHSQQKRGSLQAISEKGEVYAFKSDIAHIWANNGPVISRVAISKASTFPGFCQTHDTSLFLPIEQGERHAGSKEQADLFFFRAYTYEYTRKMRSVDWCCTFFEEGDRLEVPLDYSPALNYCEENLPFLQIEKYFYIGSFFFDPAFKTELCFKWRTIPGNLGCSVSCCFPPIDDKSLLEYANAHMNSLLPMVTFTLVPQANQTHAILGWHHSFSHLVQPIADRLMSQNLSVLECFINECVFTKTEDFCLNPTLWESTPESVKQQVCHAVRHEHYRGPISEIPTIIRIEQT